MSTATSTDAATAIAITREALHGVLDPCSVAAGTPMNAVEMGLVKDVYVDGADVVVHLRLTTPLCHMLGHLVEQIDNGVGGRLGERRVRVTVDDGLEWDPSFITGRAREERERRRLALVEIARSGQLQSPPSAARPGGGR